MAISKMKKLTLLAEQSDKEQVMKSIQQLQNVEVIPLPEVVEESILNDFDVQSSRDDIADNDKIYQDAEYALNYLNQFVPQPGLIEGLKAKRESFTLNELEDHVNENQVSKVIERVSDKEKQLNRIEEKKKALQEEENFLRKWRNLSHHPNELETFKLMDVMLGSVDGDYVELLLQKVEQYESASWKEVYSSKEDMGLYVIVPRSESEKLRDELIQNGFRFLKYPYEKLPKEELKANQEKRSELLSEQKAIKQELKMWKDEKRQLELAIEYLYSKKERMKAKELVINSEHLFLASGWVEADQQDYIIQSITSDLNDRVAIISEEVLEDEYDDVPIKLNNNSLVKPYELLIHMFSFPKYDEIDPTAWIAPFYFIFFGMMSADAGYGLVLFAGTFAALKLFEMDRSLEQNIRFFMYNSVSTILFGLIFGSFFGADLPFRLLSLQDDVITILIISIILGVIHIVLGFQLGAYLKHKEGKHLDAYISDHSWSIIIIGAMLYAASVMIDVNPIVGTIGIALIVINMIGIIIASIINGSSFIGGFGSGLFALTDVSGITGDIVSYSRIMALGVASANIGMAFNLLVSYFPPILRFTIGILVFLALHFLNIFIAFLGAYVHSLRLHYVEMFGKFYVGGGKEFKPLKTLEKYMWLRNNN